MLYTSGIIALSTTIVPFSRIQHIALDEGLFSRIYGLGELRIFTAGGVQAVYISPELKSTMQKALRNCS
ncbi:PH domain-containing protein [Pedobacter steynii]